MTELTGKVALVTGGSRGIGAAIAARLAELGSDVAITYAQSKERADEVVDTIKAHGRRGLAIKADSAAADEVVAAVGQVVEEFGRHRHPGQQRRASFRSGRSTTCPSRRSTARWASMPGRCIWPVRPRCGT